MTLFKKIKSHPFFIRLTNWEYWPFDLVYTPVYIMWFWFSLRSRSFFFFGAANPTIKNGGFLMESKKEIYDLIPDGYKPATLFFVAATPIATILNELSQHQLLYPLIIKPDIGMQGKAVLKVNNDEELAYGCSQFTVDFIIQPFIPYPNEMGIFYVRYPGDTNGKITGIVQKEFVKVTGDGKHTVAELLKMNPRYILQIAALTPLLGNKMNKVLAPGDEQVLVPYGNHVRGALFLDATHLNNAKLQALMDDVCTQVDGFYFGRLDIRYNTFEELTDGKNWCIIELNGAGSEPTHIYDPRHSVFFAWKEIIRHLHILCKISIQNKQRGFSYLPFTQGLEMLSQNRQYVDKLNKIKFEQQDAGMLL